MNRRQRHVGDSLGRVQAFLDAHADVLGTLQDTPARRQLDAAITALHGHALAQDSAGLTAAATSEGARQATVRLRAELMNPIAAFARKTLRGSPEFAALSFTSYNRAGRSLVAAARAMAAAAAPLAAQFTAARFPTDLLDQLTAQADLLDGMVTQRAATTAVRVGARSGIGKALASGREAIGLLDPVVTQLLRTSELLAAWQTTKRIVNVPSGASTARAGATATASVPEVDAA